VWRIIEDDLPALLDATREIMPNESAAKDPEFKGAGKFE